MSGKAYHQPYCPRCNEQVNPALVPVTVAGNTRVQKHCPTCGGQVFSQADIDAKRESRHKLVFALGLASLLLGPLSGIASLVLAAISPPLSGKAWIGAAISVVTLVLTIMFLSHHWADFSQP